MRYCIKAYYEGTIGSIVHIVINSFSVTFKDLRYVTFSSGRSGITLEFILLE